MSTPSIYGEYAQYLPKILQEITDPIIAANITSKKETGFKLYEHFISRIKESDSMREKCRRKNLPETSQSALKEIRDSIGIRIVCGFVDDIYKTIDVIKAIPGVSIYNEKDYILNAKPNGYRSYHLILEIETEFPDVLGNERGTYFVEVQLRTIAQDSWASLEHQMKYKHDIKNPEMITRELKRCADELASQGYEVDQAFNGQEAVDLAAQNAYQVMIMDIMMPIKTGIEALKEIRSSGDRTHVIMLTAMAEIDDRVTGLDAGADDYLTKPISLKELLARLRSLERRVSESFTAKILTLGSVRLDQEEQELVAGNAIRLSSRETKLMAHFMLNPAKKLTTEHLFKTIWEDEEDVDESIVWVYISYLRQKLQAIQADISILGEKGGDFCLLAN